MRCAAQRDRHGSLQLAGNLQVHLAGIRRPIDVALKPEIPLLPVPAQPSAGVLDIACHVDFIVFGLTANCEAQACPALLAIRSSAREALAVAVREPHLTGTVPVAGELRKGRSRRLRFHGGGNCGE